jgi:tetratricopeptide (TPR) repeat protein
MPAKRAAQNTRPDSTFGQTPDRRVGNAGNWNTSRIGVGLFSGLLLLLVAAAIVRSAIATRLDGFTVDEAYHIAAGVSYVRLGDFRINPEHPPLVKLWVGNFVSRTGFRSSAPRPFSDKQDERTFAEEDVYLHNDPDAVQKRARGAMWAMNGLLLVALGFPARRAFGPGVALGTITFLAIDPTVAAHLPVVMTDLPVSLLCACAVLLTIPAFQNWRWTDLAACSVALGLGLATKHSAPLFLIFVFLTGCVKALLTSPHNIHASRLSRFAMVVTVVLCSLAVLWAAYGFRYTESSAPGEVFNRPLADKIADVHSAAYRAALRGMRATHIVPRAYIWGLADTVRAGLEGRITPITAFGRAYVDRGPKYYFPAMIALKLPIGLMALSLVGLFAFAIQRAFSEGALTVLCAAVFFLLVLMAGSTYAGIRHALPVVALMAILGGVGMRFAFSAESGVWKAIAGASLAVAAASALPVSRPWEYFNEIIGGSSRAWLYFSDEGVDLGQRVKELAGYYHRAIEPSGEVPFIFYGPISEVEQKARRIDWLGRDPDRDQRRLESATFSGTVIVDARFLGKYPFWDNVALRSATPAARFGNLMVFRGTCACGPILAGSLYQESLPKIFAEKPDWATAQRLLQESVALDPSAFFVHIELANVYLAYGRRADALRAYSDALEHAPNDPKLRQPIQAQIQRMSSGPSGRIDPLRDPFLE